MEWQYTDGSAVGSLTFSTPLPAGTYVVRAFFANSTDKKAESPPFTISAPAVAPTLTTDQPVYDSLQPIVVSFSNMLGNPTDWIAIATPGSADTSYVAWVYTRGGSNGAATITTPLAPGSYVARAFFANTTTKQAESAAFSVNAPFTLPSLATDRSTYRNTDTVTVYYSSMLGNTTDWIAIAPVGAPDSQYIAWKYTGGATLGTLSFDSLSPGTYVARAFFANGSVEEAQSASFTIVSAFDNGQACNAGGDCTSGNCVGGTCCQQDSCPSGTVCGPDGSCVAPLAQGSTCTQGGQCGTGNCADGVCCDSACGPCGVCSVSKGASADGTCTPTFLTHPAACAPYVCDGTSPWCSNFCTSDAYCAAGYRCDTSGEGGQCVPICTGGNCSCNAGKKYCSATQSCIGSAECCVDTDCRLPHDQCQSSSGYCADHICTYAPANRCGSLACNPNSGACEPPHLSLTVTLDSTDATRVPTAVFPVALPRFQATLTNISNVSVAVSPTARGNISVVDLSSGSTAVRPTAVRNDVFSDAQALTVLSPGQSATFPIRGLVMAELSNSGPHALIFAPPDPGTYRVRFQYQYVGVDEGLSNVDHDAVVADYVSFEVVP